MKTRNLDDVANKLTKSSAKTLCNLDDLIKVVDFRYSHRLEERHGALVGMQLPKKVEFPVLAAEGCVGVVVDWGIFLGWARS
jgi:hypothetical protein